MSGFDQAALVVKDLRVELTSGQPVVQEVSLVVGRHETLGIVGESGSGKTTTALAMLGYAHPAMRIAAGTVTVNGETLRLDDERAARKLRGRLVSYVPQDPATSLNPSLRVGKAIADIFNEHGAHAPAHSGDAITTALARAHLPVTAPFRRRFPHQISGGQQQRLLLAMALVCEPPLMILDEPTTGLDVVTQADVLGEIRQLQRERGIAMVYVSHDLAVVSQVATRVAVMYAGYVIEQGPTADVLANPRHPYTHGLVSAIPDHRAPRPVRGIRGTAAGIGQRPRGCPFVPRCDQSAAGCEIEMPPIDFSDSGRMTRCFFPDLTPRLEVMTKGALEQRSSSAQSLLEVRNLRVSHKSRDGVVVAAANISFSVAKGECVALVGESGSGKTSIARAIAGLHRPDAGELLFGGARLEPRAKQRSRELRRRCQIIFQNPYESLNPRRKVVDEVARVPQVLRQMSSSDAKHEALRLLERVRLPASFARRYPTALSGGERQRVAIARALAAAPDLLICDEVTSALDVSVQASVLELLIELRSDLDMSMLFITHNLGVVAAIADRVLVLADGDLCEEGPVDTVLSSPSDERTRGLIDAAPSLSSPSGVVL